MFQDPVRVMFICLLTCLYIFLSLHWVAAPRYVWIYYMWWLLVSWILFLCSFFTLKISFVQIQVCISLTDHWWNAYSHQISSVKSVPHLLSSLTCTPLCFIPFPFSKASFIIPGLYWFILHNYFRIIRPWWYYLLLMMPVPFMKDSRPYYPLDIIALTCCLYQVHSMSSVLPELLGVPIDCSASWGIHLTIPNLSH